MHIFRTTLLALLLTLGSACSGGGGSDGAEAGACGAVTKILNGETCSNTRSIVRLEITNSRGGTGTCTGTFISQTSILTAAHCLVGDSFPLYQPTSITILFNNSSTAASAWIIPELYVIGKAIDAPDGTFDIGIVKVDERFMPAVGAVPQPLLRSREPSPGETAVASGFGLTETGEASGELVRAAEITLTGRDEFNRYVAIPNENNRGVCFGDSGGPLLARAASGEYGIIGVTSFGTAVAAGAQCGAGSVNYFSPLDNIGNSGFLDTHAPDAPKI